MLTEGGHRWAESLPTSSLFAYSTPGMWKLFYGPDHLLNFIWSVAKGPRCDTLTVKHTICFYTIKRAVSVKPPGRSVSLWKQFLMSFFVSHFLLVSVPLCLCASGFVSISFVHYREICNKNREINFWLSPFFNFFPSFTFCLKDKKIIGSP